MANEVLGPIYNADHDFELVKVVEICCKCHKVLHSMKKREDYSSLRDKLLADWRGGYPNLTSWLPICGECCHVFDDNIASDYQYWQKVIDFHAV